MKITTYPNKNMNFINPLGDTPYGTYIVALIDNRKVLLSRNGKSRPYVYVNGVWRTPDELDFKRHYDSSISLSSKQQLRIDGKWTAIHSHYIYRIFAHAVYPNFPAGTILYGRDVNTRKYDANKERSAYLSQYYDIEHYSPTQQKLHTL